MPDRLFFVVVVFFWLSDDGRNTMWFSLVLCSSDLRSE